MKNPFMDQRVNNDFDSNGNNFLSEERSVYQTPTKRNIYAGFDNDATPQLTSPSKAALKYSPRRKTKNTHILPIHGGNDLNGSPVRHIPRSEAVRLESPIRGSPVIYNLQESDSDAKYNDDDDDDDDSYFHNSYDSPSKMPTTFTEVDLSDAQSYDNNGSYKERMTSYSSYTSSNFSGDTFGQTKFNTNHHDLQYIRRAQSTVRPKIAKAKTNKILTLDNPIPSGILDVLPNKSSPEYTEMRYTAVTSDPDSFAQDGYSLRFSDMNRECEIVACITMYNEDKYALARTLNSVVKNVTELCNRDKSRTWGRKSWKKVQIVIISDGRSKINRGSLDYLISLGVYQEDMAKSSVNGIPVQAHLFELTTQISIDENLNYVSEVVPCQILFCLKEENKKKINSHRWLFNAFCPLLDPNTITLIDVGTKLGSNSLYYMWKEFDLNSNVAGVAGQIIAMKGKYGRKLLNPIVAAQNFEYKMSNILDKPLESTFGYISVLPGALSSYRYRALKNHEDGTGPLHSYFLGETQDNETSDVFTANMYLAEDRILCWELIAKKDSKWVLKYVKEATGETDVPEEIPEFISQRRRWLNGAMFADLYSKIHFYQIFRTKHSTTRKTALLVLFFYQFVQFWFSWFSIANFYLTFYFLAGSMIDLIKHGVYLFTFFKYLLLSTICALFIISMGNRPQGATHLFIVSMVILSICTLFALITGLYFASTTLQTGTEEHSMFIKIIVSLLSTYGLYIYSSLIYLDPWHLIHSFCQYLLMVPTFICTLQIFALCNTHDVSWGTKGSTKEDKPKSEAVITSGPDGKTVITGTEWPQDIDRKYVEVRNRLKETEVLDIKVDQAQKSTDYYRDVRTRIVTIWMLSNLILCMIITQIYGPEDMYKNKYLVFILISVAALALFRALFSTLFLAMNYARSIISFKNKYKRNGGVNVELPKWMNKFKKNKEESSD
ncbi:hypothetical protein HANVADRAFT_51695 [Hanseniaspora valbyensis NRRL Y-1626]|uniref:Chitin synthase n=1 Tax=Hanseniaspora valbyensis NRRL Y-1626 TaxID=766949 RepID=A0A1B7TI23_9ASCO|nr:hypothetical protein HANVADRAFT_51695 [Hanseniaspora valbyensis NRRL Y-1626]